jgi:retinol dehydrogenase-12
MASQMQRLSAGRRGMSVVASATPKRVFITGGNTGIGYQTAKELCRKGYDVTIACRDASKAAKAQESLK